MSSSSSKSTTDSIEPIFSLAWNKAEYSLVLTASGWLLVGALVISALLACWRIYAGGFTFKSFEIDQADIGIGDQKFSFKPNMADKQVAYAIWVELSTRKIGLPIDFENDVVSEIYDSWHGFFTVTRELVKGIPAQKVKRDSTQKIVRLSIEVLNEGLRPHLTRWQARFRHWYDRELKKYDASPGEEVLDPQLIQERFPKFDELKADMERVNQSLIKYRQQMHLLVLKD
tara:strand:+ start:46462 stop:47148 length:687 start_codon:yes stop_codon:yes gene_type:complete